MESRWEHFDHGADIGVRGIGASLEEAFAAAAQGLTAIMTDPEQVVAREWLTIELEREDLEILFLDWLDALIYEAATRRMLWCTFEVALEPPRLHARVGGEPFDAARHPAGVEVKGATFTELAVHRDETGAWIAQAVVDV